MLAIHNAIKRNGKKILFLFCLFSSTASLMRADGNDLDNYKFRGYAYWWFSQPSGHIDGAANSGSFDLQKDLHFGSYSTFSGNFDWRFKRKHHLLFGISPVSDSHSVIADRTITFQGETYDAGSQISSQLQSLSFAPGYQWDFIRRDRGYVALSTAFYLLSTKATLTGTVTVNGQNATRSSSGSVFAPLPVLGPRARWYPLHSGRLALDGFFQGMYFFGYGDFYSARGNVEVGLARHLHVSAGYQLGSRLSIHGGSDQLGVRLTQKGPVVGIEESWGSR